MDIKNKKENERFAQDLLTRFQTLENDRKVWDSHWEEIAEVLLPRQMEFVSKRTDGEKRQQKVFDSTAPLALERFAATLESMLTPRAQKWHKLKASDPDVNKRPEVQKWFDMANRILFEKRYSPKANFASQMHETYTSIGAFGTGSMFIDDFEETGLRYKSIYLGDIYFQENHQGLMDTIFRRYSLTARQAAQSFDYEMLTPKIQEASKNKPDEKFKFLHIIMPNEEVKKDSRAYEGMKYASYNLCVDDKYIIKRGGFRVMPYAVSRYVVAPNETYGRGPGVTMLPDIKMLNEMEKTTIRAGHKAVDPPLLLPNDGVLSQFSVKPNALNFGGVDQNGKARVQPLQLGTNLPMLDAMKEAKRKNINDAFLVTLFQILTETPRMTATEVMERAQEKGALLAPAMGRLQTELLGPVIEREIDILLANGSLPEVPGVLEEAGGAYEVEYESPLSRSQRAEEVVGMQRLISDISPLVQFDPTVADIINPDGYARVSAEVHGVPFEVIRSEEEVAKIRAERQQKQQVAEQTALAQQQAVAAKDATTAAKNMEA